MTFDLFAALIWYGLVTGAIYALLAIGFSLVYGVLEMMNFAHGEVYMVGAFASWAVLELGLGARTSFLSGIPTAWLLPLMLLAAIAASVIVALGVERIAFRPLRLRGASRLAPIISAVGASIAIRQGMIVLQLLVVGNIQPRTLEVGSIFPADWHWRLLGTDFTGVQVAIIAVSLTAMVLTDRYVQLTRAGKAMRATAQDAEVAETLGIDVTRIVVQAFVVGAVLAAVGGTLIGLYYGQIDQFIGFPAVVKAFIAAVIGGIGNIRGAMLGGMLLGLVESLSVAFIDASYRDAVSFAILMVVLLFRPSGLLGQRQDVYERA